MKILYIGGCTHSGSTLLNRVLGAHPRAISVGSLKKINRILAGRTNCACGAPSLFECDFWNAVDQHLRSQGTSLEGLNIRTSDRAAFVRDNTALFRAIQAVSGAEVIIDCSRKASRLRWLQAVPELDVVPLHLYKQPLGQSGSWKRKGLNLFQQVMTYWTRNLSLLRAMDGDPNRILLSYEYFCTHPEEELRRVFARIGVPYDEAALEHWGEQVIHTLGGNRMKKNTDSRIVLDENWRERLNGFEVRVMDAFCSTLWKRLEQRRRTS